MKQKDKLKSEVTSEIYRQSEQILISGLSGIRSCRSFDFDRVDYVIPSDTLDARVESITESIVELSVNAVLSKIKYYRCYRCCPYCGKEFL